MSPSSSEPSFREPSFREPSFREPSFREPSVGEPPPVDRLAAAGTQLVEIHEWLRDELNRIRASLDAAAAPSRPPTDPGALRAHCLAFCAAVTRHHTTEDGGAFVQVAERFPELRPVIEELHRDHGIVSGLLEQVQALARSTAGAEEIRRELDGLAALLESHFTYEERKLAAALTELGPATLLW